MADDWFVQHAPPAAPSGSPAATGDWFAANAPSSKGQQELTRFQKEHPDYKGPVQMMDTSDHSKDPAMETVLKWQSAHPFINSVLKGFYQSDIPIAPMPMEIPGSAASLVGKAWDALKASIGDPAVREKAFKALIPHGKEILEWKNAVEDAVSGAKKVPVATPPVDPALNEAAVRLGAKDYASADAQTKQYADAMVANAKSRPAPTPAKPGMDAQATPAPAPAPVAGKSMTTTGAGGNVNPGGVAGTAIQPPAALNNPYGVPLRPPIQSTLGMDPLPAVQTSAPALPLSAPSPSVHTVPEIARPGGPSSSMPPYNGGSPASGAVPLSGTQGEAPSTRPGASPSSNVPQKDINTPQTPEESAALTERLKNLSQEWSIKMGQDPDKPLGEFKHGRYLNRFETGSGEAPIIDSSKRKPYSTAPVANTSMLKQTSVGDLMANPPAYLKGNPKALKLAQQLRDALEAK